MLFSKFSLLWNYTLSDLEEGKICNPCRGAIHMCRTHQTVLLIIPSKHETLNHCSYNVGSSTGWHIPNTRRSPKARSMLPCHLRRWTNIDQTLDELLPFARLLRLSCKSGQTYWRDTFAQFQFRQESLNPHTTRKTSYWALFRSSVRSTCRCTQWYIMPN